VLGLKRTLFVAIALVLPLLAFPQIAKADVAFTVTNMDFNPVTGDFSFDYDAGGVTLNHQITLRAPLDASSFNYDVNAGSFSCTASHCSGTYTGDTSGFNCVGSDYRVMSTTDVNGNGEVQYTSSPLTAAEFSSNCTSQSFRVDSTEWLDADTFRVHYSGNDRPGAPLGLIYVESDGSFHAGAWSWNTSAESGYVDFGANFPGQDGSSLYWGADPGYTRYYKILNSDGDSSMFRLHAFDSSTPAASPVSIPGCTVKMSPAPQVNTPESYTGSLSISNDTDNQPLKDLTIAVYPDSNFSYLTNNGWSIVDTGQPGSYFKRLHTDTNPIAPHTTQDFALSYGTSGANQLTIQAGNTGPDSTQVCGLAGIQFTALNVGPAPNQAPAVSFTASATTVNEGDTFTANGSFSDPDSTSWIATVDYGDGSGTQQVILSPNKTFSLSHVYVDNGSYVITVSITDDGGQVGISTGSGGGVVVNNPAPVVPPITAPSNASQDSPTVIDVPFSDYGNQGHTATVNWGDGSGDQSVPVSGNDFSSGHSYQNPGTYTVTVTVTDSQGATTTQTLTITVLNVAPTVGTINFPSSVAVNSANPLSVNFTDPGTIDTHTAAINWGDGNTTTGVVTESHGSGSVSGNHTYTTPGSYTVTVTVTDNNNGAGSKTTSTTAVNQLSALNPAGVWIGLKNSDDVGTKFDLKVEAYSDNTLVASGELDSFAGGSSGFNNAHLATIPFNSFSPINLPSGSVVNFTVSVRNACVGSGHNSGTARLWYDDSAAASNFGATVAGSNANYYLRDAFALATTAGTGPKKTIDVQAGAKCSAFKPFGTWSKTL